MDPHIGHWHCRYRRVGAQLDAALAVDRLERTVRPRVLETYGNVLDQIFENDPTVYILRRVNAAFTLDGVKAKTEIALADAWGNKLGAAVMRGIATNAEDGGNLVKFENEADYVAHFIVDLLNDLAWDRWYYGAYSELRGRSKTDAILSLLLRRRELLGAIFGYLSRLGCLDRVLGMLDRSSVVALWSEGVHPAATVPSTEEFRVFVRCAIRLIDHLGLWAESRPTLSELLERYAAERPVKPDWSSRVSLAAAVLNVVRFLARQNYIQDLNQEQANALPDFSHEVFADLDWVDIESLKDSLPAALAKESSIPPRQLWPSRLASSTPLQLQLLERIRDLLHGGHVKLDLGEIDSAANAVRIFAALAAEEPELAAPGVAASIIENLLLCSKWIKSIPEPLEALASLSRGSVPDAFELVPTEARAAMLAVSGLGTIATNIVEEVIREAGVVKRSTLGTIISTECAGLFLLLRAVLDARLPQLAESAGVGPLSSILLALGIHWAGEAAVRDAKTDPGLALWCGLTQQSDSPAELLAELDEDGCKRLLALVTELYEQRSALDATLPGIETSSSTSSLTELATVWPLGKSTHQALSLIATFTLRLWARWLPGISGSNEQYLLGNLVRRNGELKVNSDSIEVVLSPEPLDIVLEMASYLREISDVPWLDHRTVAFRVERS